MQKSEKTLERRGNLSKPRVFGEKRRAMWLIESASPSDIYLWCFCIAAMFSLLSVIITISYIQYYK